MANREIKTKVAIDGEKEYKESLKNINSALGTLKSELKLVESQYAGQANSYAALSAKGDVLSRMYDQQKEKVKAAAEQLEKAKKAQSDYAEKVSSAQSEISRCEAALAALGDETGDTTEEQAKLTAELEKAKGELVGVIDSITSEMTVIFKEQFALIRESFQETFLELFGGGKATLELEDENDVLSCGIEIKVQPPGKQLKTITLLSGGEKAFVAIALYFAILKVHPTPFCVMDEIEAALDEANVVRYARYMRRIAGKTQFIVITHRRGTMEAADVLYCGTMQEQGVSKILTINLNDMAKELKIQ